ncbi:amidase [Lentisalinibacter sediminis]|uniref:amidase n=1 Tax=Lentisalinibacter sediminis TaxID=2992237 RepID=UPI0038630BDA
MTTGRAGLTRRQVLTLIGGAGVAVAAGGCGNGGSGGNGGGPGSAVTPAGRATAPLHYESLLSLAARIQAQEISPVALTEAMLGRIEDLEPSLRAYATVMSVAALEAAERAEVEIAAGNHRGPLHGVPVAVKDLCYTKAVPTMGGMAVYRDFVPDHDATVVARLKAAGAVLLGKLNLTEGAMAGYHPSFEVPKNPWDPDLWPGVSSSGSGVATAAGLCFGSLGSDTGGSIRFPSQANGIVGLKPTYGRVSRYGVIPLAESLDHVGPMTRRVADAAAMLQVIGGPDPNDPTTLGEPVPDLFADIDAGVKGLRIGYDEAFATEGVDPRLASAIQDALGQLAAMGAEIVDVTMPAGSTGLADPWSAIAAAEALEAHGEFYPERADEFGPFFREFLQAGAALTDEQLAAARAFRADYAARMNELLGKVDAIAMPAGNPTIPVTEEIQRGGMEGIEPLAGHLHQYFAVPANFSGAPALTLPCGFTEDGVPLGMQYMAAPGGEAMLCRIGHAYEGATAWHNRHPGI